MLSIWLNLKERNQINSAVITQGIAVGLLLIMSRSCVAGRNGGGEERTVSYGKLVTNGAANRALNGTLWDASKPSSTGLAGDGTKGGAGIKGSIYYWAEL